MEKPPKSIPQEGKYLALTGTIETREGDIIICGAEENYSAALGGVFSGKWAFKSNQIPAYIPRVNEKVMVVGKIVDVIKGKLVIGAPLHLIVVEAEAIEADCKFFKR